MAEERDLQQAKTVYATLCKTLDSHEWKFNGNEEELCITCVAQGEDLPMQIKLEVDAKRHLAILVSHLPFVVPEDKRLDIAVAVSTVNYALVDGSFDYDVKTGHMFFRMTTSYLESEIGSDAFTYMLFCSCKTIDEYNDKFLMLAKNMMTLEQFISKQ